jgi:putative membrane protein
VSWKLVATLAVLALVVIFSAQNYEVVQVRFLVWRLEMSRAVLLFLVLAVGLASGWALATLRGRARRSHGPER